MMARSYGNAKIIAVIRTSPVTLTQICRIFALIHVIK